MFHKIMEFKLKDADTYYNHGSTWIILTDKKQWIIELTKEGTLWYNYYFFESILCGMMGFKDIVENQHYITEWVENFIQNGVKHTDGCQIGTSTSIEDTIQNGVKETFLVEGTRIGIVENTIQNGVKETKHTLWDCGLAMEESIQNGIKETNPHFLEILNPMNFEPVTKEMKRMNEVNIVLEKGIKETKYCELHSLMRADHIIRDGIKETWGYEKQPQIRVTEVINEGIKETNWRKVDNHPTYLDNIINSNKLGLSDGQS